ncbi:MAG: DUF1501 domain-containing protein, partial [Rhodobacteraceae bacterium]|nr:DUF1501 domain-containing protein [Paracoccaceae bacterium]
TVDRSKSLSAFWTDLAAHRHRLTVVTMTEFGRRVQENDSEGTDHGAASYMMVLSGAVTGGKMYGDWPGLAPADLTLGDLTVATDNRQVLSEILAARHGQNDVSAVFPTLAYQPLGLFA